MTIILTMPFLFSFQVLLLHLENIDPVASEARYHHSCYMQYTRFMRERAVKNKLIDKKYRTAFKEFCDEVVIPRIIVNKEIFRMTYLTKQFQKYIQEVEHAVASIYRTSNLKQRL